MNFKVRIKEICKERGILQKDLAVKLGITYIGLNKSLRGEYPQLQTLERIAAALDVPVIELFERPVSGNISCPKCGTAIKITAESISSE